MIADLVPRLSQPVPRYTSYPTAPHFHGGVTAQTYRTWLGALAPDTLLSLYLHIPFCDRLCWFCACHTRQTLRHAPVARYLNALHHEIETVAALTPARKVSAVHLGGGSPTMLEPDEMAALGALLRTAFSFIPDAEIAVEIDPNDMTADKAAALAAIGVNRASLGIQDFDADVQQAINRLQSFEQTADTIHSLRQRGIERINVDLLYGLPLQTEASVRRTLEQVMRFRPSRIALFGYAHVPWMKKHQTLLPTDQLPDAMARYRQARMAEQVLLDNGYLRIGIDHFALPEDSLARAAASGQVHRNFQGYTTDGAEALLGFGASAIGRLPQGYVQNDVPTHRYEAAVREGKLATSRGFELSAADRARGYAIESLMCSFRLRYADLKARFGDEGEPIRDTAQRIAQSDEDGLVVADGEGLQLTDTGRVFARVIASKFDSYLGGPGLRHSVAV